MLEGGEQITNTDTNLSNTSTSKWDSSLIYKNVKEPEPIQRKITIDQVNETEDVIMEEH